MINGGVERGVQRTGDFPDQHGGFRDQATHGDKTMDLTREMPLDDPHAGLTQAFSIVAPFVFQRIAAAGDQVGRCHASQVCRQQR